MDSPSFSNWLEAHEARMRPLQKELDLESWALATTGKKTHEENVARLRTQVRKVYADPEAFALLSEFRKDKTSLDALLSRQLEIIWTAFAQNQFPHELIEKLTKLETEVEGIYSNFRGKIDGQSVDNNGIRSILRSEENSEKRQEAWLASKQIGGEVAAKVLQMVKFRNQGAKKCGFSDYYRMSLQMDELSEERLFTLLDELAAKTERPFLQAKEKLDTELAARFQIKPSDLKPWHYADPFFQEAPPTKALTLDPLLKDQDITALTSKTFEGMGMDIAPMLPHCDLFARDGKDQHAFCTMIARSKDVRVLCNIEKNEYWMSTMLHEFGHAVYDYYLDETLPYFLYEPAHTLSTEAIAMLFGRMTRNKSWLQEVLGLPKAEVEKINKACIEQQSLGMLVFVRWVLVMTHFERELYRNPTQDLNRLWWKLVERYQHIRTGMDRNEPDWAAKLHLALAPVYYQNYLMGELIASQLQNYLTNNVPGNSSQKKLVNNQQAGTYLIEHYFKKGAQLRWDKLLEKATGEPLNPQYFISQFVY